MKNRDPIPIFHTFPIEEKPASTVISVQTKNPDYNAPQGDPPDNCREEQFGHHW